MVTVNDRYDAQPPDPYAQPPKSRRGCLWILIPVVALVLLLGCCGGIGALFYGGLTVIKSSEPYREGIKRVQANEQVKEQIGDPIEPGMLFSGEIKFENEDGRADLNIPVSGPKGSGTVNVRGSSTSGNWTYESITFTPEGGGEPVDLTQ